MNYANIKTCDIANGPGVRTSLFVSGCTHRCKNCFNAEAWSFDAGQPFTDAVQERILTECAPEYITGLSLLGGEPMEPANQRALVPFLRRFRARYGATKTLWVYTGCVLDTASFRLSPPSFNTEVTREFLAQTDVLVDGPFIEAQKDISLRFRGSANQRILDLRRLSHA